MSEKNIAIQIEHVTKEYRIGVFNHKTFRDAVRARWAKLRGREDPTKTVGVEAKHIQGGLLRAVDDVSLTVRKGESLGIIGANGAGKSTLLKLICRVTAPTQGNIGINGRISSMLEVGVGFMPELTGKENIYLSGAILGMSRKEVDRKIDDIAAFSECEMFLDTPLKRYSSGMRVKLGFSIAAHLDNEIMIMDEVLAVGDLRFQKKCLDRMSEAAAQEGKTVLYVSHNMSTIRQLCTRCIVMDKGKIIFDGETEKAISLYCTQFSTLSCDVDLQKTPHFARLLGGLEMTRVRVPDREIAVFERGESLRLLLRWQASRDIQTVLPLMHLYTRDGLALAWMIAQPLTDIKNGVPYETALEIDIGSLSVGEYSMALLMADPENGRVVPYDGMQNALLFDVVDHSARDMFGVWRRNTDGFFIQQQAMRWTDNREM